MNIGYFLTKIKKEKSNNLSPLMPTLHRLPLVYNKHYILILQDVCFGSLHTGAKLNRLLEANVGQQIVGDLGEQTR